MNDSAAEVVQIAFGDGAEGRACALADNLLSAIGPVPYAPGRPLSLCLALTAGDVEVRGKSLGAKRRLDGQFDLRIRLVDLRREHREALQAALQRS